MSHQAAAAAAGVNKRRRLLSRMRGEGGEVGRDSE